MRTLDLSRSEEEALKLLVNSEQPLAIWDISKKSPYPNGQMHKVVHRLLDLGWITREGTRQQAKRRDRIATYGLTLEGLTVAATILDDRGKERVIKKYMGIFPLLAEWKKFERVGLSQKLGDRLWEWLADVGRFRIAIAKTPGMNRILKAILPFKVEGGNFYDLPVEWDAEKLKLTILGSLDKDTKAKAVRILNLSRPYADKIRNMELSLEKTKSLARMSSEEIL